MYENRKFFLVCCRRTTCGPIIIHILSFFSFFFFHRRSPLLRVTVDDINKYCITRYRRQKSTTDLRADISASLDPEPRVLEVQQRILRGPQRARVPEHGGSDRKGTRVRDGLQLRAHGHPRGGVAEARRWRRSPGAPGRRGRATGPRDDRDDCSGPDYSGCGDGGEK